MYERREADAIVMGLRLSLKVDRQDEIDGPAERMRLDWQANRSALD